MGVSESVQVGLQAQDIAAIELHGVAKLYGRTVALRALSLRLEAGQTLALLGPNGSGKTTLLKIMAGAITPTLGRGSIFGRDMLTERAALRGEIGLLASETFLYDDLTAAENLRFIATMASRKVKQDDLAGVLTEVELLPHADERVRSFSSGMRRRLALARLLLLRPRLLLLDEPYNSLDASGVELVDRVVRGAMQEGRAAVLATHDMERALGIADLVVALDQGAVRYSGPARSYRAGYAHHLG
jgi:heme exporter protein A